MSRPAATVLVVETETGAETGDRLARALDDIEIQTAETIPEALSIVEGDGVECVVSDYEIPDEEGLLLQGGERLLRAVRERDESMPFVLFTEVGNEAIARKAIAEGASDYIWRYDEPAAYDRLVDRVRAAIERRQTERRADHLHRLNETMRLVHQAVIRAEEPDEIDSVVVERIVQGELYSHAAIGDVSAGTFQARATAQSAHAESGLDWESVVDPVPGVGVTVSTMESHPPVQAVGTMPVVHGEVDGGILALATDREDGFGDTERAVLAELGETIAHALGAVRTRQRLELHEQELRKKNQRLEHFASAVSHDLRNPLQVASSNLTILADDVDSERIDKVEKALQRMESLIKDVLALARQDDRGLDLTGVPLENVAQEAWDGINCEGCSLTVDPAVGLVEADHSQLQRLFENMFRNAVEHGAEDPDGTVSVRLEWLEDDGQTGFAIEDDGSGIDPEDRETLFEMGHTTGAGNTGLGLTIVDEIVEAHDWSIEVTNGESGGARFEITGVSPAE